MESVPSEIYAILASYLGYSTAGDYCREKSGKIGIKDVDAKGNTYKNGLSHSYGDKPAVVIIDGDVVRKMWFKDGVLHRDGNLPAVVHDLGNDGVLGNEKEGVYNAWYKNGKCVNRI